MKIPCQKFRLCRHFTDLFDRIRKVLLFASQIITPRNSDVITRLSWARAPKRSFYRRVPENHGGKSAFQFVKIAKEHIQTCTKQKMSN